MRRLRRTIWLPDLFEGGGEQAIGTFQEKSNRLYCNIEKNTPFNSEDYTVARIRLSSACQYPFLYVVDNDKEFLFNSNMSRNFPNQLGARSCCPSGSCWNGFTCVNNMATSTFQVENVDGAVEYRCIDGNWKEPDLLDDWHEQVGQR